jgi:hypothetical protein
MLTYPYVEDYLELLGGYEVNSPSALLYPSNKLISLARYDVAIVDSMSSHTVFGGALTDRQADLCVRLVLKYRRQFAKIGVDVTPVEIPEYRIPPRKLDRTRAIWLDDDKIAIKFPFDNQLIDSIKEFKNTSQGSVLWNKDKKQWNLGLTEFNVNWAVAWGEAYQFSIDEQLRNIFDDVIESEKQEYKITLVKNHNGYAITNAAPSLISYVETNLGGFGADNTIKLVDYAGTLGYEVGAEVLNECPSSMHHISTQHSIHLRPSEENLDIIFDYARVTGRYPVCIYNPTLIDIDLSRFDEADIVRFDQNGKTKTSDYDPYNVKIVYAHKIPKTWDFPVPLLVTTFEMMFGGRKLDWTQRAERIIYYSNSQLKESN